MRRTSPALLICLFVCFAVVFLTVPLAAGLWAPVACLLPTCPGAPQVSGWTFSIPLDEVGAVTVSGGTNWPYPYEQRVVPLRFPVTFGAVEIYEDQIGGKLSDLLVFRYVSGQPDSVMIISDVEGYPLPDPSSFFEGPSFNFFSLIEQQGVGGYEGVLYLAGNLDSGVNSYDFTSDVPEPGTLMLLGSGLIGAAGFIRRRRAT
jgi:hypothetical protein